MKTTPVLLIASLTFAPVALQGLVNLGEGQIIFNVRTSVDYDSSIRSRSSNEEDFIFSLNPTLTYSRPSRNFDFSASLGVTLQRYAEFDENDDENFYFDLNITPQIERETSRFTFSGNLIFNSETRSEDSVGEIITTRNYGASGQVIYDPNQRYDLIGEVSYTRSDPDSDEFPNQDNYTGGVTVRVPVNQRLSTQGGVRVSDASSGSGISDGITYTYFVGFSGMISSKLSGNLNVGMQDRQFDEGASEQSPYVSGNLSWIINERTRSNLTLSRNFGSAIDSRSSENTSVSLGFSRSISEALSANLSFRYDEDKLDGRGSLATRTDEEKSVDAGLSYQIARWGSIRFNIRYSDQTSTDDTFEFDRVRAGVSLLATF
jgi:hypothetical protein